MGNDGGSIPTRRELVKEKARNPTGSELRETLREQQEHRWNTDPLTLVPLERPVVSDALGRIFNKDCVLEFLLGTLPHLEQAAKVIKGSVKSIKDIVDLKFEYDASPETKKSRPDHIRKEMWICPITRKELGPNVKAAYLVPCGHVFSEAGLKHVPKGQCVQCDAEYAENDVITLLPTTEEELARLTLRQKTLAEKGLTHSLKKVAGSKKKKRKQSEKEDATNNHYKPLDKLKADVKEASSPKERSNTSTPQPKPGIASSGTINNPATASLTAKVLEEQRAKRRKLENNENVSSLFTKKEDPGDKSKYNQDFMTRGFSIKKS